MENFEARVKGYLKKLGQSWSGLEKILDEAIQEDMDLDQLRKSEQVLCIRFGEHRMLGKEYEVFLSDTRTKHSLELMEGLKENERRTERIVNSVLGQIELKRKLLLSLSDSEKMSTRSSRTKSSHSSNARSKAEAAKARIRLTEKETELKKRQARIQEERAVQAATAQRKADEIEADLGLLRDKKLYAEAAAEAEAYITLDEFKEHEENSVTNQSVENPMERTRRYVENHASSEVLAKENLCSAVLKPDADSFVPRLPAHLHSPPPAIAERKIDIDMGTEFGRFLVKKDLLMTRFTRFQDDPVTYTVWKATFRNITEELGVNPSEEIDLLVKWLGPESSKQALSLRSANAYNPVCGLHRIWERLDARYGTPELVESALRKKITSFPKLTNKDNKRLYDLLDLLLEVASLKETPEYMPLLATYDTSLGVNQIVSKIPYYLQNRWMSKAAKYKLEHGATFPPFIFFVQFIREQTAMLNDPCFSFHSDPIELRKAKEDTVVKQIRTRKTDVDQPSSDQPSDKRCPLHPHSNTHCLDTCKEFAKRSIDEKRQILKDNRICFRCCASDKHLIKDCKTEVKCAECKSPKHVTALHIHKSEKSANRTTPKLEVVKQPDAVSVAKSDCSPTVPDGGEDTDVTCNCAQLCGAHGASKSCAKIVKVNVHLKDNSNRTMQLYALIDDQSNRSLASPELLENFKDFTEAERIEYTLSSCAGTVKTTGRRVKGLVATSMDGETTYELPTLIECSEIPANPSEIPIPEAAAMHPHLKDISDQIPPLDTTSGIHLLLGRDAVDIHHVLDQRIGPKGSPFAQKIGLGWVIIGEVCLNKVHPPNLALNVNKTYTVKGHDSIFEPCQYNLSLREDDVEDKLFEKTKEDDKPGWSVEDRLFIEVMNREFFKDKQGFWSAPLPFRLPRKIMPNNRSMALQRAKALQKSLNDNPVKKQHFVTFMDKVISSSAAEVAPTSEGEVWYLPIFGVYNAQKPNQIRGVFDSSATFQGTSLNDQLLPGPNLTNNLIGLLLRFRENEFAAAADIEQMFYSFHVNEGHRNLLRFFWYRNNDPTQDLIEFRMKAHVFGNSPSPAVAAYGLRKSVEGDAIDQDVKAFVNQNFYVDDGLVSSDSEESVISLLKRTQNTLKEKGNLRLHKFISNSPKVMSSFPAQDLGKEMKNLQLDKDNLPTHKSLGLLWDLNMDNFTFDTNTKTTACTRRGILSMLNSIYDPLGFAAPITIRGKVLMRDLTKGYGWDDSLPEDAVVKWNAFEMSIAMLRELLIPRMIVPVSLSRGHGTELHVFCDASEQAVCAVAYLRTLDQQANQHMGFVLGKAKVAPTHGHTIPRLELCAALLGTEIAKMVEKELSVDLKSTKFYTDSKVVLGYLNNNKKRFYQYVSNRVQRILDASTSEQWFYIASQNNPADCGTRGLMTAEEVKEKWLTGPRKMEVEKSLEGDRDFPLLNEKRGQRDQS